MLTEQEIDSLERVILKAYNSYNIDIPGWANSIKNMTESRFMMDRDVQDRARQDMFIRKNFQNEDVITYIYISLKEFVEIIEKFDKDYYLRAGFVRDVLDWWNVVSLLKTELAKHGDISGV